MSAMVAAEQLVDEGAVHLVPGARLDNSEFLFPETRGRRRWLCRSTVPISMSAMVAAEQLVDEGAVHANVKEESV